MSEARSIRQMADDTKASLVHLQSQLNATTDRKAQKLLRSRIHALRMIEGWLRTRNGYR